MQQKVAVTSPPEGAIWVTFPKWGGWWIDGAWTWDTLRPLRFDLLHQQNHVLLLFFLSPRRYLYKCLFLSMSLNCSWGGCNSCIYEMDSYLCQAALQFSPTALISHFNKQNNECRAFLLKLLPKLPKFTASNWDLTHANNMWLVIKFRALSTHVDSCWCHSLGDVSDWVGGWNPALPLWNIKPTCGPSLEKVNHDLLSPFFLLNITIWESGDSLS